jgi:hypothetical protein
MLILHQFLLRFIYRNLFGTHLGCRIWVIDFVRTALQRRRARRNAAGRRIVPSRSTCEARGEIGLNVENQKHVRGTSRAKLKTHRCGGKGAASEVLCSLKISRTSIGSCLNVRLPFCDCRIRRLLYLRAKLCHSIIRITSGPRSPSLNWLPRSKSSLQ